MTQSDMSALQTKTTPNFAIKNHVYTMAAAFAGVIFGVLGSMGFVGNYLNSQFAAQTASLNKQLVAAAPASATTADACYAPTDTAGNAHAAKTGVSTAVAPMHADGAAGVVGGKGAEGGNGGGQVGHVTPFVSQMVNGSISNTGPNSSNSINATNNFNYTATNNNNVSVNNSNSQSASSGSANVSGNTNGGSAHSGDSDNHNQTDTFVNVQN